VVLLIALASLSSLLPDLWCLVSASIVSPEPIHYVLVPSGQQHPAELFRSSIKLSLANADFDLVPIR
jgi:hypothetical protein